MDDATLLRSFVESRSEAAFGELVRRNIDWVYSSALRQVGGDRYRAEEVTQMVFIALARKAALLRRHPALLAWLHRTTRFAAANVRRAEMRRRAHEAAAAKQAPAEDDFFEWEKLRPVLDDAVNELGRRDREAILLRFFANEPLARVGERIGVTENAARMRVGRALDRLCEALERKGITSTAGALAAALAANAASAAPAGIAATAAGAALAGAAGGGGALAWLSLMSTTKLQVAAMVALAAAGTIGIVVQQRSNARLEAEIAAFRAESGIADPAAGNRQVAQLRLEHQKLAQLAAEADSLRAAEADLARLQAEAAALSKERAAGAAAGSGGSSESGPLNDLRQLDAFPTPISQEGPSYPLAQRMAGNDGTVTVAFTVGTDGAVRDMQAVDSSDPAFEQAASEAVATWRFQPGMKAGAPVPVRIAVPILFSLEAGGGSWF